MTMHSSLGTILEHGDLEDGDDDSSFCSGIRNIRIILQQEEESARQEGEQSMKVRQSSLRVKTTSTRKKYWAWRLSRGERQWEKNTRTHKSNQPNNVTGQDDNGSGGSGSGDTSGGHQVSEGESAKSFLSGLTDEHRQYVEARGEMLCLLAIVYVSTFSFYTATMIRQSVHIISDTDTSKDRGTYRCCAMKHLKSVLVEDLPTFQSHGLRGDVLVDLTNSPLQKHCDELPPSPMGCWVKLLAVTRETIDIFFNNPGIDEMGVMKQIGQDKTFKSVFDSYVAALERINPRLAKEATVEIVPYREGVAQEVRIDARVSENTQIDWAIPVAVKVLGIVRASGEEEAINDNDDVVSNAPTPMWRPLPSGTGNHESPSRSSPSATQQFSTPPRHGVLTLLEVVPTSNVSGLSSESEEQQNQQTRTTTTTTSSQQDRPWVPNFDETEQQERIIEISDEEEEQPLVEEEEQDLGLNGTLNESGTAAKNTSTAGGPTEDDANNGENRHYDCLDPCKNICIVL